MFLYITYCGCHLLFICFPSTWEIIKQEERSKCWHAEGKNECYRIGSGNIINGSILFSFYVSCSHSLQIPIACILILIPKVSEFIVIVFKKVIFKDTSKSSFYTIQANVSICDWKLLHLLYINSHSRICLQGKVQQG